MISSNHYINKYTTVRHGKDYINNPHFIEMEDQAAFTNHPVRRSKLFRLIILFGNLSDKIEACWDIENTDTDIAIVLDSRPEIPKELDDPYDTLLDHISHAVYEEVTDIFFNIENMIDSNHAHSIHDEYFKWKKIS